MKQRHVRHAAAALLTAALCGCAGMMPTPSNQVTLNYSVPELVPVQGAQEDQQQGGVDISTQGAQYNVTKVMHREYNVAASATAVNNMYPAQVREIPAVAIAPQDLQFKVSIRNHLARVLSLSGLTVSFVVGDTTTLLPASQVSDLLATSIQPGAEYDTVINGPSTAGLADGTPVTLTLANLVTSEKTTIMVERMAIATGMPTVATMDPLIMKSSFGFHYTLQLQAQTEQVPVTITQTNLTQELVQLLAQRVGQGIWGALPELDQQAQQQ
ncbi:MAG TPA: hypothetical protein VK914_02200 [bacterium]|jgi:hypothetical protein|nr:hypothetical protein [bacterium]